MSDPGVAARLHEAAAAARDLLSHLEVERWEVFAKASTTREVAIRLGGWTRVLETEETGVAVRSRRRGCSGFAAASGMGPGAARGAVEGALDAEERDGVDPLPPATALGTSAPAAPQPPPPAGWSAHAAAELAGAISGLAGGRIRPLRVTVQEGLYAWLLTTADGFVASHQDSSCSMLVETVLEDGRTGVWREWVWVPQPGELDVRRMAAHVCDRHLLMGEARAPAPAVREVLLHGEVTAHLMAALLPLFTVHPAAHDPLPRLLDRDGRLGSRHLTLQDDNLGAGPLRAPCDGEGLPARRLTLLAQGVPRHRLATYRDGRATDEPARGGAVRHSYRDHPAAGPANLLVDTSAGVPAAELLTSAPNALYLLRPLTPITVDAAANRFHILGCGVTLAGGRVRAWHPVVELKGRLDRLLQRVAAVGADLSWYQTPRGLVGAPTLLLEHQAVT